MREEIGNKVYNYLLGFEMSKFNTKKLPTYRDVMNVFMYKHRGFKITIRRSSNDVFSKLNDVWSNFLIPTCQRQQSIKKLETFHSEYLNLKKNRKLVKKSKKQQEKTNKFNLKLNQLFDITDNSKYQYLPDNCKEFLTKSRNLVNCFQLANELLSESAILDDQDIDESIQFEENTIIIQKELSKYKLSIVKYAKYDYKLFLFIS